MAILQNFIDRKQYVFAEEAADWKTAIHMACEPIISDGTVSDAYPDEIVRCVEKYGPYIVLIPGVAMPHSQEGGDMVHKTTISFMKLQKPVVFDPDDEDSYADLFFTLASCNPEEHLREMSELSEMLQDEELVEELHMIKNVDDLQKLADKYKA